MWVRLRERVEVVRDDLGPVIAEPGVWQAENLARRLSATIVEELEARGIIVPVEV